MFYSILRPPPYEIEVYEDEDGSVVPVSIAEDGRRTVAVVSRLDGFIHNDEETFEFSFEILVFSNDDADGLPFRTMDRHIASQYIPLEIRQTIIPIVVQSLCFLVDAVRPSNIYMVTKDGNLPEKAMPKFDTLVSALLDLGFEIAEDGTDISGRRFWTMRRY